MGDLTMQLAVDNTTRFFAVVGAPYVPERHRDDCCDEAPRHFAAADFDQAGPQATGAMAWWPRNCH